MKSTVVNVSNSRSTRSSVLVGIVVTALLSMAAGVVYGVKTSTSKASGTAQSSVLFAQTLPDSAGKPHALADYRGKTIVLNFWATWCAPCIEEIPELSKLQTKLAPQGVQFIGIGIDKAENIAEFQKNVHTSYPLLVAAKGGSELARQFGNSAGALPFTVIITRAGLVGASKMGQVKESELMALLKADLR